MLRIIEPGLQASIQDQGRLRYASAGLGRSGAMNPWAIQTANVLLGNQDNAAAIEFAGNRLRVKAEQDVNVVVAGYDTTAIIQRPNGETVTPGIWSAFRLLAGDLLEINSIHWSTRRYLAIQGGFNVEKILGSHATDTVAHFGGYKGRYLLKDDVLEAAPYDSATSPECSAAIAQPFTLTHSLRAISGPEEKMIDEKLRAAFWQSHWQISPQSNRMGCRLMGKPLHDENARSGSDQYFNALRSHAVLPGTVQLPQSGLPVILLADGQTTGGYPRIAKIIDADLWKLAHIPVGELITLETCKQSEAISALKQQKQYIEKIKLGIEYSAARSSPTP